jgi:hypothetical protein
MIITSLLLSLIIVTLLLINSLGWFSTLKIWFKKLLGLAVKIKMNNTALSIDDKGVTSLKLEAQKISEYNGDYDAWPKWKSRTECAFNGSGYDKILTDDKFAKNNPKMNAIVYSQLAVATVDGNAHHLVKQYESERDGYKSWQALIEWYDGDVIRNETAESLREKLETLSLHPGVSASDYVNKYMMRFQELEKIPGEGMSSSHARYLFLRNISDDRYETTIKFLRNSDATLQECITAIRKEERDQLRKRSAKRKLQTMIRRLDHDSSQKNDGERGSSSRYTSSPKKIRRLTGTIETTENGFLSIPHDQWNKLTDDDKAFVQKYNSKVKLREPLSSVKVPDGVTIKTKVRRNRSPEVTLTEGTESPSDDESEKPSKKPRTGKKVHFSVESSEDNESE